MQKIPSIDSLEKIFLDASSVDDIGIDRSVPQDPNKKLSADEVRHDVAVFGRILTRAYVGWPVHDDVIKRTVLTRLLKVYNAAHDMTAGELVMELAPVISGVVDNHLRIEFDNNTYRTGVRKIGAFVGQNITDKPIEFFIRDDGVAVLSFGRRSVGDDIVPKTLKRNLSKIKSANALIIDYRHNGGGSDQWSNWLAAKLCGAEVRSALKQYLRRTPDARRIQSSNPNKDWDGLVTDGDWTLWPHTDNVKCNLKKGYNRPIYILTDGGTCSSSEMFIARMRHHPLVRLVGGNTAGCEVYGYVRPGFLPHSKIRLSSGMVYREMEIPNFETNGFTPDIVVSNGGDAMDVALVEIKKHIMEKQIINDNVVDRDK